MGEAGKRSWLIPPCSTKHLNLVHSGNVRASMELQEKISEYFGVSYYKMVAYGEEILKALKEFGTFPVLL